MADWPEPTLSDSVSLAVVNKVHAGIQAVDFGSVAAAAVFCPML